MTEAARGVVLSCFDHSGTTVKPWAEAGYRCFCVDIKHPKGETTDGNVTQVGADMRFWLPPVDRSEVVFAAFYPPCTDLATSGSRWFKEKGLRALIEALELFDCSIRLAEWLGCPYFIENPRSTISTYWRQADYHFNPNEYGDPYTKRTYLWTGGGFIMPDVAPVLPVEGSKMGRMGETKDRAEKRSITPPGFAEAIFKANAPHLRLKLFEKGIR